MKNEDLKTHESSGGVKKRKLTGEQEKIVNHVGTHARVVAVAGSGKTTTMVERIIRLIRNGQKPKNILVLMFNKSASDEFSSRLAKRGWEEGISNGLPEVRTFHSMALKLCKYLVTQGVLKDMHLETREWVFHKMAEDALKPFVKDKKKADIKDHLELFYQFIDLVNSDIISPQEKAQQVPDIIGSSAPKFFPEAFESFDEKRREARIRFFSDIIKDPVMAMISDPEVGRMVGNFYDHIILDEYQDINEVQQIMTRHIAAQRAEVMAVGDADQCIYEWRGARPEYIVELFEEEFPGTTVFTLSRTYRYGHRLSMFANNIITLNKKRDTKICISSPNNPDTTVTRIDAGESAETAQVSAILKRHAEKGIPPSDCAILLRKFSSSLSHEIDLIRAGSAYRLVGSDSFFRRKEVMAIEGYLHILNGSLISLSIERRREVVASLLKIPYSGIKSRNIDNRIEYIINRSHNPHEATVKSLEEVGHNAAGKKVRTIKSGQLTQNMQSAEKAIKLFVAQTDLYKFFDDFSSSSSAAEEKKDMVEELIVYARHSKQSVSEFLEQWVSMAEKADSMVPDSNTVLITSIHRSKGLEWPVVIMPNLSDDNFPGKKASQFSSIEESERRLFYVGATRAINHLYLIHCPDRGLSDWKRRAIEPSPITTDFEASRFLYEGSLSEVNVACNKVKNGECIFQGEDEALYALYAKRVVELEK